MLGVEMLYKELFSFLSFGSFWPCLSLARREHSRTAATGWSTAKGYHSPCFSCTIYERQKKTQIHIFAEKSLGLWVRKLYFLQLIRHSQQVSGQKLTSGPFYRLWVVLLKWRVSRSSPPGGKCCTACGSTVPRSLSSLWARRGPTKPSTVAGPVWPF